MGEQIPNTYEDFVTTFFGGMDSGVPPRLLPPDKAAFLFNATMRGGFPTDRPKVRKMVLSFEDDIESAVTGGMFQASAFFKPQQTGAALVAAISGRLFQFTPDSGVNVAVTERTIEGDPNSATAQQSWIWQSELWLIWNDGTNLPVFVDDTTSRRSNGPAVTVGTTAAVFTIPAIGSNVTLTLAANYTGDINNVVKIGSAGNFIIIAVGTPPSGTQGYEASIKNINDTPGNTLAVGTPITVPPTTNEKATVAQAFNVPTPPDNDKFNLLATTTPGQLLLAVNSTYTIAGRRYKVVNIQSPSPLTYRVQCLDINTTGSPITVPVGTPILDPNVSPSPGYTIGNLVVAATVPAVNASVSVFLDTLYADVANKPVTIGGKNYQITSVAQEEPTPSTTIIVKNLDADPGSGSNTVASGALLRTIPELGIGRMGVYGRGRNWMALMDGISFTASDLVGQSSGSSAYNFRDAVLKVTKNDALSGGKPFRVPNAGETIQGMSFVAELDKSLGQGPLQVLTDGNVFSCNAPFDDATWAVMTNPIITESLKGAGGTSQASIANSNSDFLFRSLDGIRSFLIARLDFNKWGNTPISHEMERVIDEDNSALLQFSSAIIFDNRLLMTANPVQSSQGVYHRGLMVINFDEISSLGEKSPSIYDGLWTGLQILQLVKGNFGGKERAFAFCLNTVDNEIELWEILPTGAAIVDDMTERVIWGFESPDLFRGERGGLVRTFKALEDGEISLDDVQGRVDIKVFYKPDQYPGWLLWHEWAVENDMNRPNSRPGYFPRMGLGRPPTNVKNDLTNQPTRFGYTFQVRVVIQGHCRFLGSRFAASKQATPQFAKPICGDTPATTTIQIAELNDWSLYDLNAGIQNMNP